MNRRSSTVRWSAVVGALAVGGALVALAGPLDPPAGPVAPTGKTLTEVEPRIIVNAANTPGDSDATPSLFKITQPGSYYLTGNITGVSGRHGIEIVASGVTLDLNGFDVVGVAGSLDGVSATVLLTGLCVRNGSVRGWAGDGVDLGFFAASNSSIIDVHASGNSRNGIFAGVGCTVSGCTAALNGMTGIFAGDGSTVVGCAARDNTQNGFMVLLGCAISQCTASSNSADGIAASARCTVTNCSASFNNGDGIDASGSCSIHACSASSNDLRGFNVLSDSTLSGCAAFSNSSDGIFAGSSCTIEECTSNQNTGDGIEVTSGARVVNNTCAGNGNLTGNGAGIHASGSDNHIGSNNCTGADRGIDVDSAGNIVIRNSCSGNTTDWDIVANNIYGPIIDRRAPASPAVVGFAAASSLGSAEPNANFSY